ncbi:MULTISPECIES: hypothetical protein [Rhizobium]|uniref:hypothetical protein n=1 Tax=Rhizobium TaxID=379 RepID=UPI0019342684|nr:hypothetical protein [Rhizobium rosettiformans]
MPEGAGAGRRFSLLVATLFLGILLILVDRAVAQEGGGDGQAGWSRAFLCQLE